MSRTNAILLVLLAALAGPPAFSADPPPRTTTAPAAPKVQDDIDPATGFARSTVVRPLSDPSAPSSVAPRPNVPAQFGPAPPGAPGNPVLPAPLMPGMTGTPSAAAPKPHIALILPIGSPQLGRLADAVRQGFAAAAESEGKNALPVVLTNVPDDGPAVLDACARSQAAGATLIITGLTRDGASSVARSECTRVPVLTLNQPTEGTGNHPQLYSISLSLEQEAKQAALLAVSEGWHSAIFISSNSALSKRVQEAFEREWLRAAGEVAGRITFSGGPDDAPLVKDRLAQMSRGDMVFLALDAQESRLVRPYVSGMLPVYATSLSIDPRAEATVNVDLQGVRYVDMPWFVQPDHPAVMVYPQPRTPMPVDYERLYALGIDAYRIATVLVQTQGDKSRVSLDGVTGRITLDGNLFARALIPAEVDGGRVIPLRTR